MAQNGELLLERDAVISDCGRYRYLLRRTWDYAKPRALIIMLNPSTADAEIDDPTIRSCVRLTRDIGYGSFEVVNLFGWRATDPDELSAVTWPIGDRNFGIAAAAISRCDVVICAWGAHPMGTRSQAWTIVDEARSRKPTVYCFGKTKTGCPKHPLYIKSGTPLETFG